MPATCQANIFNGTGPTAGSAEGGVTWGRDDNITSISVLPIPSASGTYFSYPKTFALQVIGGTQTNHITNRRVAISSAMPTGVHLWWKTANSYAQALAPASADSAINYATPSTYSGGAGVGGEVTTTNSQYDNTSVVTANGQNGAYVVCALGCDNLYVGGGGSAVLPSLVILYDEGP